MTSVRHDDRRFNRQGIGKRRAAHVFGGVAVLLLVMAPLAPSAQAAPDCKCRYAGQFYAAGDFACIKTDKGFRLARCGLSENVSTWRFLKKGCRGLSWFARPQPSLAALYLDRKPALLTSALTSGKQSRRP